MDLDSLIIAVFCLVDDTLRRSRRTLAPARPAPHALATRKCSNVEVVGEYLGLTATRRCSPTFAATTRISSRRLATVHRTTFARQAANLWRVKEALWQRLLPATGCDPTWALVDSFPVAVCRFARAPQLPPLPREAGYGHDHARKPPSTASGCTRACWPGVVTRLSVCAGGRRDVAFLEELTDATGASASRIAPTGSRSCMSGCAVRAWRCSSRSARPAATRPLRAARHQPHPLSHRDGLRPTLRAVHDQAGLGARPVAPVFEVVAEGAGAYGDDGTQPRAGQRAVALG